MSGMIGYHAVLFHSFQVTFINFNFLLQMADFHPRGKNTAFDPITLHLVAAFGAYLP